MKLTNSIQECRELVFWSTEALGFGLFFTLRHFHILENFSYARENSITWDNFWGKCTNETKAFCLPFFDSDERKPSNHDLLCDLSEDIFILGDKEFPLAQCAEETCSYLGLDFLADYRCDVIRTEYGEIINLYSTIHITDMFSQVAKSGFHVQLIKKDLPFQINDY